MSVQRPVKRVVTSALALALCLAGFGGGTGSTSMAYGIDENGPVVSYHTEGSYEDGASGAQDTTSSTDAQAQPKLVRIAYLSLRTREFEKADESLQALVKGYGAVVYSNDLTDSGHDDIHLRTHSMNVRIGSSKLDDFLASLSAIDGVVVEGEDDFYGYAEGEYDYYPNLFEETDETERYGSQDATIDRDVDFSEAEVWLREDPTVSDLDSSTGMGAENRDPLSALFSNLLSAFATFTLSATIKLIPLVGLVACDVIAIWFVVRYVRKKRKGKAPANAAPQAPTQAPSAPSSDPVQAPPASSHDPALLEPPASNQTDGPAQP